MNRQFTGRHFLLIILAFFGVIIGVNITMAVYANTSWTGFVVRNSYVAGLDINRRLQESRDQAALGWSAQLSGSDGTFRFALADAAGGAVWLKNGTAVFRRPVSDAEDVAIDLSPSSNGALDAPFALADGAWIVEIEADTGRQTQWRDSHRVFVKDGAIQ